MYRTIIVIVMMMVVSLSLSMAEVNAVNTEAKTATISDGDGIHNTSIEAKIYAMDTFTNEADVRNVQGIMLSDGHLYAEYEESTIDNINTMIDTDSIPLSADKSLGNIDGVVNLNQVDKNEVRLSELETGLCENKAFKGEVFANSLGTNSSGLNFSNPVVYIEEKSGTEMTPSTGIRRNNRRDDSGNIAIAAIYEVAITDKTTIEANYCWVTSRYLTSEFRIIDSSETTVNDRTTYNTNSNDYSNTFTDQIIINGPSPAGPGDAATVANTNTDRLLG